MIDEEASKELHIFFQYNSYYKASTSISIESDLKLRIQKDLRNFFIQVTLSRV